jgi:hypothetical protein
MPWIQVASDMSRWEWAAVVWGIWAVYFVIAELTAAFGVSPWPTLSTTTKELEGLWVWAVFFVLVGLVILNIHLVWHFLPALLREIGG